MKGWISVVALSAVLVGCGGGGGGTTAAGSGRVAVLVTDSFREEFSHVWTTIFRVELLAAAGGAVTVFDDAAGHLIDLKTLRDATGARFLFLASQSIPEGTYTGVRITVGPNLQLFPSGSTLGTTTPIDDAVPRDSSGNVALSVVFPVPRTVGAGETQAIVTDFDLAHFVLRGGKVTPRLQEGERGGLDDAARHEHDEYQGAVGELSGAAPTQVFSLARPRGMSVTVVTTAATAIFGSSAAVPGLANGQSVEVKGRYNAQTDRLVATAIEIHTSSNDRSQPEISGAVQNVDGARGTFQLAIHDAFGFVPAATSVLVVTGPGTLYRSNGGRNKTQAEFFSLLAARPYAEVKGVYDASTNTLTALRVKIEDHASDGGFENESHHDSDDDSSGHSGGGSDDDR